VVEDCLLTQHVLTPTHDDSILDLVLTNEPDLIRDVSVINSLGSSDWWLFQLTCTVIISLISRLQKIMLKTITTR